MSMLSLLSIFKKLSGSCVEFIIVISFSLSISKIIFFDESSKLAVASSNNKISVLDIKALTNAIFCICPEDKDLLLITLSKSYSLEFLNKFIFLIYSNIALSSKISSHPYKIFSLSVDLKINGVAPMYAKLLENVSTDPESE